jgi:predicted nucleic acid-binding protein
MDWVVNASPLILLCKVGRCDLLHQLCPSVYVPEGVVAEIEAAPGDPAAIAVRQLSWLRPVAVEVPNIITAWDLGRGESEVLAFALGHPNTRPLLDDAEGKACALSLGLKPLGTAGLLILAKNAGLLVSVREVVEEMRMQGLWMSDSVFRSILQIAGE